MRAFSMGLSLALCLAACGDDDAVADGGTVTAAGSNAGSTSPPRAGSGSSSNEPLEAANATEYFAALADLICNGFDACCSEASLPFNFDGCMRGLSGAGSTVAGLAYDRDAGEACLQNLQQLGGDCTGMGMSGAAGPLSIERLCEGVFVGTTALGEPCEQAAECEPSDLGVVACEPIGADFMESCVVEIRAEEGDPCVETCFEGPGIWTCSNEQAGSDAGNPERGKCFLNDGLRCDRTTLECVATLEQGETCTASDECGAFAVCDGGTCAAGAADGEACADYSECEEGLLCMDQTCMESSAGLQDTCSTFDRL